MAAVSSYGLVILLFISSCLGLATINGHSNKLVSKHYSRDYFDSSVCLQEAECMPLQNATCFGTSLPYTSTSIALAEDSISQFEVQVSAHYKMIFTVF